MHKKNYLKRAIIENFTKNILIVLISIFTYNAISQKISVIDSTNISDFLLIISILIVTVCFANFAFSYEYSDINKFSTRLLSHVATFIFMLLIVLLLEILVVSILIVYPSLFSITVIFSILLYLGIILYDIWDLLRAFNK